jgi:hypothetical protein
MEFLKMVSDLIIIPVFGMVWSIQGRISRMEGELKALYSIVNFVTKGKEPNE